jgi:hypothetical protein
MATSQIDGGRQIKAGTITNNEIASGAAIADSKLGTSYIKTDGTRAFTGDQSMGNNKITSVSDAVADTDVPSFGQIKAMITGKDWKDSVDVATTTAGTLASSFENGDTVDGQTLVTGWRILIKDQAAGAENGIYVVNASGAPTRATDADSNAEVTSGMMVPVVRGTANGGTNWQLTTAGSITLGSTALAFSQVGETLTVDSTLIRTGHQLGRAALTGDVTASAGSNATTIANNAVTKAKMADDAVGIDELETTGTPDGTKFLRDDMSWQTIPGGGLTASNFVTRETPSGTINGSNPTFTLANTPTTGTEQVYLNGLLLDPGAGNDYTISGGTLTMLTTSIPASGDKLRVTYMK